MTTIPHYPVDWFAEHVTRCTACSLDALCPRGQALLEAERGAEVTE